MDRDDALDYRVLYTLAIAEIEWLRARAAEVVAAWQREDDSVGEAIEVLGRALQPKEGEK